MLNHETRKKYFHGIEIPAREVKSGYISYATLSKAINTVLRNDIFTNTCNLADWEIVNGCEYLEDEDGNEEYLEVYQLYIIDKQGADILRTETDEIVYYSNMLDTHVWGVRHWGTSWEYVNTSIAINW